MKAKEERYLYIDILNILACLSVIFMHCNGIVHTFENSRAWKESMIVETLCYWAVPVFFMITGTTLLGYRERYTTGTYLKKRIMKTLIPFMVWTLISLGYKLLFGMTEFEWGLGNFIDLFNNSSAEAVYWFFIPLFMVYLSIPVISLIKDNKKILLYMTAAAFIIYSVYPVLCTLLHISANGSVIFPVSAGYMLYVLLGYLLSETELNRKQRYTIYVLAAAGVLTRYGTTVIWSMRAGALIKTFWGYLNFPAVFLACGVYVFIKHVPWDRIVSDRITRFISKLSGTGFGIYLMHMMVYHILEYFIKTGAHSYIWRFIVPFVIYAVCASAVLIIKKIPLLKYIVP